MPTIEQRMNKQAIKNFIFFGAMNWFVDDEDFRALDRTFFQNGFEYATDGRILARRYCGRNDTKLLNNGKAPPNVHRYNSEFNFQLIRDWIPLKLAKISKLEGVGLCPVCDGRRIEIGLNYPPMDDNGKPDSNLYPSYDIDSNTCGDLRCWKCKGECYEVRGSMQKLFGKLYQYRYLKRIKKLWFPEVSISDSGILIFRSRLMGIEGLLMHCTNFEEGECY